MANAASALLSLLCVVALMATTPDAAGSLNLLKRSFHPQVGATSSQLPSHRGRQLLSAQADPNTVCCQVPSTPATPTKKPATPTKKHATPTKKHPTPTKKLKAAPKSEPGPTPSNSCKAVDCEGTNTDKDEGKLPGDHHRDYAANELHAKCLRQLSYLRLDQVASHYFLNPNSDINYLITTVSTALGTKKGQEGLDCNDLKGSLNMFKDLGGSESAGPALNVVDYFCSRKMLLTEQEINLIAECVNHFKYDATVQCCKDKKKTKASPKPDGSDTACFGATSRDDLKAMPVDVYEAKFASCCSEYVIPTVKPRLQGFGTTGLLLIKNVVDRQCIEGGSIHSIVGLSKDFPDHLKEVAEASCTQCFAKLWAQLGVGH